MKFRNSLEDFCPISFETQYELHFPSNMSFQDVINDVILRPIQTACGTVRARNAYMST